MHRIIDKVEIMSFLSQGRSTVSGKKTKALIVDDSKPTLLALSETAASQGYAVTSCADAESALDAFVRYHHPLVLTDWTLPGMDGLELCRKIRQLPVGDNTVIIIITTRDNPEYLEEVLQAGADDYIPKQLGLDRLAIRLKIAKKQVVDRISRSTFEKALKESEMEYSRIVQNAQSIILQIDRRGIITSLNGFAEKVFLYSKEELIGKNIAETIVPQKGNNAQETHHFIKELCEKPEEAFISENENVRKDGKLIWVSWRNKAIVDENGKKVDEISKSIDF